MTKTLILTAVYAKINSNVFAERVIGVSTRLLAFNTTMSNVGGIALVLQLVLLTHHYIHDVLLNLSTVYV
jgi:hypothetical protein